MKRKFYFRDARGYTLAELLVVLCISGMLLALGGIGFGKVAALEEQAAYNRECEMVLNEVLYHRDRTIMAGTAHGDRVRFFENRVYFGIYDAAKNDYVYTSAALNHTKLTGYLRGKTLEFNPEGTVNIGGNLVFAGQTRKKRTLIVQIGAGRIYLRDEN